MLDLDLKGRVAIFETVNESSVSDMIEKAQELKEIERKRPKERRDFKQRAEKMNRHDTAAAQGGRLKKKELKQKRRPELKPRERKMKP